MLFLVEVVFLSTDKIFVYIRITTMMRIANTDSVYLVGTLRRPRLPSLLSYNTSISLLIQDDNEWLWSKHIGGLFPSRKTLEIWVQLRKIPNLKVHPPPPPPPPPPSAPHPNDNQKNMKRRGGWGHCMSLYLVLGLGDKWDWYFYCTLQKESKKYHKKFQRDKKRKWRKW